MPYTLLRPRVFSFSCWQMVNTKEFNTHTVCKVKLSSVFLDARSKVRSLSVNDRIQVFVEMIDTSVILTQFL
jgi:hypothetical protein